MIPSLYEIGTAQIKWITPVLPRCLSLLLQEAGNLCTVSFGLRLVEAGLEVHFLLWRWLSTGTSCPEKLWSLHPWRYSKPTWTWQPAVGDPALSRWLDEMIFKGLFQPQRILWYEHMFWLILAACSVTLLPPGQFWAVCAGPVTNSCSQSCTYPHRADIFPFTDSRLNQSIYFMFILPSRQKFTGQFHWVTAFPS